MTSAPAPQQVKPSAAHKRLNVFNGDWHAEGTSYGDGQDAAHPRAGGERAIDLGVYKATKRNMAARARSESYRSPVTVCASEVFSR
jgi:hypothetical protein